MFCLFDSFVRTWYSKEFWKMNEVVKRLYVNTTMLAPMVRMVSLLYFKYCF